LKEGKKLRDGRNVSRKTTAKRAERLAQVKKKRQRAGERSEEDERSTIRQSVLPSQRTNRVFTTRLTRDVFDASGRIWFDSNDLLRSREKRETMREHQVVRDAGGLNHNVSKREKLNLILLCSISEDNQLQRKGET
jgi:hypothetical protein